jgi:hypothetical protein
MKDASTITISNIIFLQLINNWSKTLESVSVNISAATSTYKATPYSTIIINMCVYTSTSDKIYQNRI